MSNSVSMGFYSKAPCVLLELELNNIHGPLNSCSFSTEKEDLNKKT